MIGYEFFCLRIVVSPRRNSFREPKDLLWRFYLRQRGCHWEPLGPHRKPLGSIGEPLGSFGEALGASRDALEAPREPRAALRAGKPPFSLGKQRKSLIFMVLRDTERNYIYLVRTETQGVYVCPADIYILCVSLSPKP